MAVAGPSRRPMNRSIATGIVYASAPVASTTVEVNSPIEMANANAAPATTAGQTKGSSTSRITRAREAPSARADSTSATPRVRSTW